jgi:hypothetical protein
VVWGVGLLASLLLAVRGDDAALQRGPWHVRVLSGKRTYETAPAHTSPEDKAAWQFFEGLCDYRIPQHFAQPLFVARLAASFEGAIFA